MYFMPPDPTLIVSVEKLQWQSEPFQSGKSFDARLIVMPSSSETLLRRYLAAQR